MLSHNGTSRVKTSQQSHNIVASVICGHLFVSKWGILKTGCQRIEIPVLSFSCLQDEVETKKQKTDK